MKPTIYDVAEKAGVSIATVSKVINNRGKISEKTKKKVFEVMKQLDYQPSVVASALTGKRTQTIGLLIPDIANPYFAEVAKSLEKSAQKYGLGIVMCSTDSDSQKEADYISLLLRKQVDGLIIASDIQNMNLIEAVIKKGIPIVLFSVDNPSLYVNVVTVDDYKGGYQATEHLIQKEHKDIAIIVEKNKDSSKYRFQGYMDALKHHHLEIKQDFIKYAHSDISESRKVVDELLSMKNKPTAIFACNDLLATGVIQEARKHNLHIPIELSVVGFDNTILAEISDPGLTTVAQPIEEMAKYSIDLLVDEIEQKSTKRQRIMLLPELIIRESTTVFK